MNPARDFSVLYFCPVKKDENVIIERALRENGSLRVKVKLRLIRRDDKGDDFFFEDDMSWFSNMEAMPEVENEALNFVISTTEVHLIG